MCRFCLNSCHLLFQSPNNKCRLIDRSMSYILRIIGVNLYASLDTALGPCLDYIVSSQWLPRLWFSLARQNRRRVMQSGYVAISLHVRTRENSIIMTVYCQCLCCAVYTMPLYPADSRLGLKKSTCRFIALSRLQKQSILRFQETVSSKVLKLYYPDYMY